MTPKQNTLYWREWGAARKADPTADRDAITIATLGKRVSHTEFSNRQLDLILGAFRAISKPADMHAQLRQEAQPATRMRKAVEWAAASIGHDAHWLAGIVRGLNRSGKFATATAAALEDLTDDQWHKVLIAVKKECRRIWPEKADLLYAFRLYISQSGYDFTAAEQIVQRALCTESQINPMQLDYDQLITSLGSLKLYAAENLTHSLEPLHAEHHHHHA